MDSNPKIGLITYHSAYNFGSVLQTYATIKILEDLGHLVETIDYRTPSQSKWYKTDIIYKKGLRSFLKTYGFMNSKKERALRREKYEKFIKSYLNPGNERFTSYKQIVETGLSYPVLISGSDQIWNFSCGEFHEEPFDSIKPYFLDFGNPEKRIAFASSFGTKPLNYILDIKDNLEKFDFLSVREPIGARYLSKALRKEVVQICDPTWLLSREEWLSLKDTYKPEGRPYILLYTLDKWIRSMRPWLNSIIDYADNHDLEIISISPLTSIKHKRIKSLEDAGPLDILSYMAYADLVLTNTFHGTIFSLNLEVPFFTMDANIGSRQQQMLEMCDMEKRIVYSSSELKNHIEDYCDFSFARNIILRERKKAIDFLKSSLQN